MNMEASTTQRIPRLTPLRDVLASVERLAQPVAPRRIALADAHGRVLAGDLSARPTPPRAIALRDGWAVRSVLTLDASAYAPVAIMPAPVRVDVGDALPPEADAVAPFDAVIMRDEAADVLAPVTPGEGMLAAGEDGRWDVALGRAGARLRGIDVALLRAAGIAESYFHEPRIRVVRTASGSEHLDATAEMIARAIHSDGGAVTQSSGDLADALRSEASDSVVAIGGTGTGRRDASVRTLSQVGRVEIHGMGISPGETAALGAVGARAVLLLPGRLDAALAVWLLVGRPLLARLTGATDDQRGVTVTLARKIASALGFAEVVPVRRGEGGVEPLASGHLPLHALARADGYVVVPPDSEGFAAGASVEMRPLP